MVPHQPAAVQCKGYWKRWAGLSAKNALHDLATTCQTDGEWELMRSYSADVNVGVNSDKLGCAGSVDRKWAVSPRVPRRAMVYCELYLFHTTAVVPRRLRRYKPSLDILSRWSREFR
ncbi:hypothetical protein MHUMG1_08549 [Metarhizium humberi]|uniref:Uncharacterized protein n=1 Tax=Metarhizium humberi TaxID=2596975 RepID=A0A9P8M4T3_9HYPO|nr:hypothetical protein MHUMG1_08549 [Metarhizium humberi]